MLICKLHSIFLFALLKSGITTIGLQENCFNALIKLSYKFRNRALPYTHHQKLQWNLYFGKSRLPHFKRLRLVECGDFPSCSFKPVCQLCSDKEHIDCSGYALQSRQARVTCKPPLKVVQLNKENIKWNIWISQELM